MAGTTDTPSGTPETRRRRWRLGVRPIWLLVLGTVVAVLAAGVGWRVWVVSHSCGPPESGVHEVDGKCVGVTDDSYFFHPGFTDVQRKIGVENDRVRDEASSYVTVALLDPMTPTAGRSGLPLASIRHRIEGAYTAQYRVNRDPSVAGDIRTQIRLVLVNWGSTNNQWQHVRSQLVEMSKRENDPLVAVVGLGYSTQQTQQRANDLSKDGIPMVSSYLIADELNHEHIPGLIRISPGNHHYVKALADYLAWAGLHRTVLVRDSNSDDEKNKDLFTKTLEDNLNKQIGSDFHIQTFTGSTIETPADHNLFAQVVTNICAVAGTAQEPELDVVLYAGREVDLNDFLRSLAGRICKNTPLTVATAGVDLGEILQGQEKMLREGGLRVVVASTVDAEGWAQPEGERPENYDEFLTAFKETGFDPAHLDDANSITMHDALLAAARAVRLAAIHESWKPVITAADVKAQLLNLHTSYQVFGASGTLSFSKCLNGQGTGSPEGKPIPVLQYPEPDDQAFRRVGELYRVVKCVED